MLVILFPAALRSYGDLVHNSFTQSPALLYFDHRDSHIFYSKCLAS